MTAWSKLAAVMVSVVIGSLIASLSQWPLGASSDAAIVRLSWRSEAVRAEECRRLTEEELSRVPAHMRVAESCTGAYVDYELWLTVDDLTRIDTVSPSGLRRDRPVYVLRDEPVEPGAHAVQVRFAPIVPAGFEANDDFVDFEWSGDLMLAPREVGLITMNGAGTALERRGADESR